MSVAIAPVYAGGDQNHGDDGQGEVDQGSIGSDRLIFGTKRDAQRCLFFCNLFKLYLQKATKEK